MGFPFPSAPDPQEYEGDTIFPGGRTPLAHRPIPLPDDLDAKLSDVPGKDNDVLWAGRIRPGDMTRHLLAPAGGQQLIDQIRSNYHRDRSVLPFRVDYRIMDRGVATLVSSREESETFYQRSRSPLLNRVISINADSEALNDPSIDGRRYHGFGPSDIPATQKSHVGDSWNHEGTHSYHPLNSAVSKSEALLSGTDGPSDPERAYITDFSGELTQSLTSFYNALRSRTGRAFTDPREIRKAVDELEKNPSIMRQFPVEQMRFMRSYINLKKENPEDSQQLLNAACACGQYLCHESISQEHFNGVAASTTIQWSKLPLSACSQNPELPTQKKRSDLQASVVDSLPAAFRNSPGSLPSKGQMVGHERA